MASYRLTEIFESRTIITSEIARIGILRHMSPVIKSKAFFTMPCYCLLSVQFPCAHPFSNLSNRFYSARANYSIHVCVSTLARFHNFSVIMMTDDSCRRPIFLEVQNRMYLSALLL